MILRALLNDQTPKNKKDRFQTMRFQNHPRNRYHKCDTPENTLKRIQTGFERLGFSPRYQGVRISDRLHWGGIRIDALDLACEGKGTSEILAKASAHAELAERLSAGMYYPAFEEGVRYHLPAIYSQQTRRFLNYEWMAGYQCGHQNAISDPLTIESLLRRQTHLAPAHIAAIKDCEMARHWVDGFSISAEKTVKVPVKFAAYIHGSNGLAAGNTPEEALIQAACEIMERFTQIQIVASEKTVPTIDPDSVRSPAIQEMIRFYRQANVRVTIKDFSFGGHLPVVAVLFTNLNVPRGRLEHHSLIAGAAFNREEALTRCFTEGIQGKKSLLSPRPQLDGPVVPRDQVKDFYLLMKCGVSPTDLSFLEAGARTPFDRGEEKKDLLAEIDGLKAIARELQTDWIVMDQTHPRIGFPVVRLILAGFSDFLPFLPPDILTHERTRPDTAWKGESYKQAMASFFESR